MKSIAIIGIGRWGKNLIRDFSKISHVKTCISTGNKENILWLKKNYSEIKISTDLKDVLEDPQIDSIVVSTPIKTHYKIARAALLANKHVFVEKPLTQKIKEVDELITIAKKRKCVLFVGHVFLYNSIFLKIKDIHKKEKITYANFQWHKFGTFDEDIFENLFSHDLSIMLQLFGNPRKIKINSKFGLVTKIDGFSLSMKFKNVICDVLIDRTANYKKKTIFFQTRKNFYVWDENCLYRFDKKKNEFQVVFEIKQTPLEIECREFLKKSKIKMTDTDSAKLAREILELNCKIRKY